MSAEPGAPKPDGSEFRVPDSLSQIAAGVDILVKQAEATAARDEAQAEATRLAIEKRDAEEEAARAEIKDRSAAAQKLRDQEFADKKARDLDPKRRPGRPYQSDMLTQSTRQLKKMARDGSDGFVPHKLGEDLEPIRKPIIGADGEQATDRDGTPLFEDPEKTVLFHPARVSRETETDPTEKAGFKKHERSGRIITNLRKAGALSKVVTLKGRADFARHRADAHKQRLEVGKFVGDRLRNPRVAEHLPPVPIAEDFDSEEDYQNASAEYRKLLEESIGWVGGAHPVDKELISWEGTHKRDKDGGAPTRPENASNVGKAIVPASGKFPTRKNPDGSPIVDGTKRPVGYNQGSVERRIKKHYEKMTDNERNARWPGNAYTADTLDEKGNHKLSRSEKQDARKTAGEMQKKHLKAKYHGWAVDRIADGRDIRGRIRKGLAKRADREATKYEAKLEGKKDQKEINKGARQMRREWREDDRAAGNTAHQRAGESIKRRATNAKENASANAAFAEAYYQGVVKPRTRQARENTHTTVDYARAYFESRPGRAQRQAERAAKKEADRLSKLPPSPEEPDTPPSSPDTTPPPKPKTGPSVSGGALPIPSRPVEATSAASPATAEQSKPSSTQLDQEAENSRFDRLRHAAGVAARAGKDFAVSAAEVFVDEVREEVRSGRPIDGRSLAALAKRLSVDPRILSEVTAKTASRGTPEDSRLKDVTNKISASLEKSRREKPRTTRTPVTARRPVEGRVIDTTATDR